MIPKGILTFPVWKCILHHISQCQRRWKRKKSNVLRLWKLLRHMHKKVFTGKYLLGKKPWILARAFQIFGWKVMERRLWCLLYPAVVTSIYLIQLDPSSIFAWRLTLHYDPGGKGACWKVIGSSQSRGHIQSRICRDSSSDCYVEIPMANDEITFKWSFSRGWLKCLFRWSAGWRERETACRSSANSAGSGIWVLWEHLWSLTKDVMGRSDIVTWGPHVVTFVEMMGAKQRQKKRLQHLWKRQKQRRQLHQPPARSAWSWQHERGKQWTRFCLC